MKEALRTLTVSMFFIFSLLTLVSAEEKLTITTFYPSPYGVYHELTISGAPADNFLSFYNTAGSEVQGSIKIDSDTALEIYALNSDLRLRAYGSLWARTITDAYIDLDDDNNSSNSFYIRDGSDSVAFSVAENGNTVVAGTLTVNGAQGGAVDHVFDDYDDIELLRKWREGKPLPFEKGDILNRDNLLRDAIMQLVGQVQQQKQQIELLEKKLRN